MNKNIECSCEKIYNPFLLKGIDKAVNRIITAINKREKIVVCGNYDVDGITSISLLILILRYLNADVEYYIPDGIYESNGFTCYGIDNHIKYLGANLIITVGCGINSVLEVDMCKDLNIDVVITDYHKPFNELPEGIIVNPNQKGCRYPFKDLTAAGITYKLAEIISGYYHMNCLEKYLDLVSIGIASIDLPIYGENNVLIKKGIESLKNTNNYGIQAILESNEINFVNYCSLIKLANIVMPKKNPIGRMDDARIVVELFTTSYRERANQIAKYLNKTCSCDFNIKSNVK